ncbi:rhomboid family intramembrane serine protease [Roseibium aggregatum]|uniref:Rhomboid family intramembrane serine protease n=1 Tax=Roseibium aggregatum TaxID=187304 RepID=A0A926NVG3_9HYPH|nr:rhomboid family intramembrane serine protease [Roseibium aggregatum]MBD1548142.1 rhomboid family intramembrane serine protease [Roseibium aggregatum]
MNHHVFEPERGEPDQEGPEPVFNLPKVVIWLAGIMIALFVLQAYVLPTRLNNQIIVYFAFWPERYLPGVLASGIAPGGIAADIWTFVTYAFLHGGVTHIAFNMLWMIVFGSAVARRFGTLRFLVFSAVCAAGGALMHLATHFGAEAPMIGASAAISGHMAAAVRFVFELGGPLGVIRRTDEAAYRVPAAPLLHSLADRQVITFLVAWFGLNLVFGLYSTPLTGAGGTIAWEAHVGGFLTGLALFPLIDPVPRRRY